MCVEGDSKLVLLNITSVVSLIRNDCFKFKTLYQN